MSQLISSYVFCMILAKFIELRMHLLIFWLNSLNFKRTLVLLIFDYS